MSMHAHHAAGVAWLESVEEPGAVRFCRATQQGFLRLATNTSMQTQHGNPPLSNAQAWDAYRQFTDDDRVGPLASEPAGIEAIWKRFSSRNTASPKLGMDSYLAAFAISAGMTFVTIDKAFRQFSGLDLQLID